MSGPVFDPGMKDVLRDEVAAARERGPVSSLHVLRAMLRRTDAGEAVAATGLPVERLALAVDHAIDDGVSDEEEAIYAATARGYARLAPSGRAMRAVDLLIALAEQDACAAAAVLAAHGVTPLALKLHVSCPAPSAGAGVLRGLGRRLRAWRRPATDPAAPVAVLMHDDMFTPQAFVVDVLERHVGLSHDDAHARMLEIHDGGPARIGVLPRAQAVTLIDAITAAARAQGFPLRLSLDGGDDGDQPRRG